MSRSFKNAPVVKDKCKWYHKYANGLVRRKAIGDVGAAPREKKLYRKYTPVYNISDWIQRYEKIVGYGLHQVEKSWYTRK